MIGLSRTRESEPCWSSVAAAFAFRGELPLIRVSAEWNGKFHPDH